MEFLDNIISGGAGYSPWNSSVYHLYTTEIRPSTVIYIPESGKLSQWYSNLDLWASAGQKTVSYRYWWDKHLNYFCDIFIVFYKSGST